MPKNRATPPNDLPTYRLISGPDDEDFSKRVSDALSLGYHLHGAPALTSDSGQVVVAQALIWGAARNSARQKNKRARAAKKSKRASAA